VSTRTKLFRPLELDGKLTRIKNKKPDDYTGDKQVAKHVQIIGEGSIRALDHVDGRSVQVLVFVELLLEYFLSTVRSDGQQTFQRGVEVTDHRTSS
jgi:hypothetical protein